MSKIHEDFDDLTQEEFATHVANGTLRLAFVGMSNAGKSFRSRVLKEGKDFFWYQVDAAIQAKLGFSDMDDISEWLGYPNNENFPEQQQQYLDTEAVCTKLDALDTEGKNLVFDTTGSVVHLPEDVLSWLKGECLVVHIDIEESGIEKVLQKFFSNPKPLVWGNFFSQKEGETFEQAVARCYPRLVAERLRLYRVFSHINIPLQKLFDTSAEETLTLIQEQLPRTH